ncbi:DUF4350 domain-containing protein [Mycobacteroides abscessus]|uniref:DUF4350 domain-containing protein n=1 Tax=Mycobacteroides abscessus TaxID=36809 RepID=UPI0005E78B2B|nr:DUF4350 domain-containing protein [Mycobacteroides abscessus]CPS38681.1 Uncharacterised protein [Mycobacteroides abscessus]CPS41757.1 Uncharacterised protein [Mycobacteroides abscessus]CPS52869.1 Uncharacterised protein [Mycobacteroides abscessus]CPT34386.1 Uncharacterised protein [Mycobacteroides abscessus]CPT59987.1 Uncharacterised protein [Mycobacteroides abscessus]
MTISTATSPRLRDRWRTLAWALAALVAIVITGLILSKPPRPEGYLDPDAVTQRGGHALAQLLRDHGVTVTRATTIGEVRAAMRPDSQLMVLDNGYLSDNILDSLAELPGDRLMLAPYSDTRERLAAQVRIRSYQDDELVEPGCDLREARQAGAIQTYLGPEYTFTDPGPGRISCYGGTLLRYRDGDRTITVLGDDTLLSNKQLDKQGNAALAMNLAGRSAHLVWYVPERPKVGASAKPKSMGDLIPDQVNMAIWQLCIVVLLLAIWRGRRLGPVIAEKLPVIVRASETTEGRGRLYRSRRARDLASESLREAATYRIVRRLGLPVDGAPQVMTATIAQRIGRDPTEVHHVLFGPVPSDDQQLTNLTQQLDVLERQVRES